jgi:RNA polymerase sigma factor (sigma-70 family)
MPKSARDKRACRACAASLAQRSEGSVEAISSEPMLASFEREGRRLAEPEDEDLFDAWANGDKKSGHVLFSRHHDALGRFFQNKVGVETDDLVQQTLLRCLEAHGRFRKDARFRTFLLGIAHNVLYEHFRRVKKNAALTEIDESSVVQLGTSPSGIIAHEQSQQLLRDALRRIPLISQEVLELYYWEHLKGPELAEVLGIGEGAVRSRLRRAKEQLREQLESPTPMPPMPPAPSVPWTDQELDRQLHSLRPAELFRASG